MPFRIPHQHLTLIRHTNMTYHPGFLSRSVTVGALLRLCDPFSDEAAQAFLRSEVLSLSVNIRLG